MTDWAAVIALSLGLAAIGALIGWRSGKKGRLVWLQLAPICWLVTFFRNGVDTKTDDARMDVLLLIALSITVTGAGLMALAVVLRDKRNSARVT